MTPDRLNHAAETGAFDPASGRLIVLGAKANGQYEALGHDVHFVAEQFMDHAALEGRGLHVSAEIPEGRFNTALVQIVKSKARSLRMVAEAYLALKRFGRLLVDGQKTEGIESILKQMRAVAEIGGVISKAHGKLFWLEVAEETRPEAVARWEMAATELENGYITVPGVFSSDGPDQGSELLIALVPELSGRVGDFGSGWGYMAGEILAEQTGIASMDLIEADWEAHDCARANVADPRARHIWGDVTTYVPEAPYDAIICNPPFHAGRAADPDLGRAFIAAAARNLTPRGRFFMVANQHLPYEAALKAAFGTGRLLAEIHGYKLYEAAKPKGARGGNRG